MAVGDCLRYFINGMFSAASLLTGPESQPLSPNGYGAWMEYKLNDSDVASDVDFHFIPETVKDWLG